MHKTIIVGSASLIKINAVKDTFRDFSVSGLSCESGVHEQPIGLEETERGARNRAQSAFASASNPPYYSIGIENGMVKSGSSWIDLAAIVIIDAVGKETTIWSKGISIPDLAVKDCMDANGQVFKNWSPLKDPHMGISGKPRQRFLSDALKSWKNKQTWGL